MGIRLVLKGRCDFLLEFCEIEQKGEKQGCCNRNKRSDEQREKGGENTYGKTRKLIIACAIRGVRDAGRL